jgi:hypothetical protein
MWSRSSSENCSLRFSTMGLIDPAHNMRRSLARHLRGCRRDRSCPLLAASTAREQSQLGCANHAARLYLSSGLAAARVMATAGCALPSLVNEALRPQRDSQDTASDEAWTARSFAAPGHCDDPSCLHAVSLIAGYSPSHRALFHTRLKPDVTAGCEWIDTWAPFTQASSLAQVKSSLGHGYSPHQDLS